MRRTDLILLALVVASSGGWVCQSNAENRCPGALTCDVEIANVCCPFGSGAWCDGACTAGVGACHGDARACVDDSRVLECSFSATLDDLQCADPQQTPMGTVVWSITARGTLEGCGQETAFVASTLTAADVQLDCGSWTTGVFGGCIPPDDDVSTTTWNLHQSVELGSSATKTVIVQVLRGHGADPVLAEGTVTCQ